MSQIFISYRRDDSETVTGRIFDRLASHYGKQSVLMDVDNIPVGMDFRDVLNDHLRRCAVMLAIVGQRWFGPAQGWRVIIGNRSRIDEETDWVRIEIETALKRKIPVIPVLVNDAPMPSATKLPPSLKEFAFRQAARVANGQDFHSHVDRLVHAMDAILAITPANAPVATGSPREPSDVAAQPIVMKVAPQEGSELPLPAPHPEPRVTSARLAEVTDTLITARDGHLFGPGPKQLLAIDGGGIRCVISLAFLERLEAIMTENGGRKVPLSDRFDLIGGSSTGAFLATVLALGESTGSLKEVFFEAAPAAFKRSIWRLPALQPKFDARRWGAVIESVCGDRSLDTADLKTGLCVVTKRMDVGASWVVCNNPRAPYWETPTDQSYFGNQRYRLADVVRASTAAPGYFEPVELPISYGDTKTKGLFVDGSLSMHNNPSLMMFNMTRLKSYGLCWPTGPQLLTIVSIGAGSFRTRISLTDLGWLKPLSLALNGLVSLAGETETFVLTQMQLLGETLTPWFINSEIGSLSDDSPPGGKWFRFLRYDVRLEQAWLSRELGVNLSDAQVTRLRTLDDPAIIADAYEIGRLAAEKQVKKEHWVESSH